MSVKRSLACAAAAALAAGLLGSCSNGGGPAAAEPDPIGAEAIPCAVGSRPSYFVPGESAILIGCARLATSSRRAEFSLQPERIRGSRAVCVNPAFRGRGNPGMYIPAHCLESPIATRAELVSTRVPRQGVNRYGRVLWGVAPADARRLAVRIGDRTGPAAAFRVGDRVARRVGTGRPFTIFVAEVPAAVAADDVEVTRSDHAGAGLKQR